LNNPPINQGTKILEASVNCLSASGYEHIYVGPPGLVAGTCSELSVGMQTLLAEYSSATIGRNTLQWQITLSKCCGWFQVEEADEFGVSLKVTEPEAMASVYAEMVEDWWQIFVGVKEQMRLLCQDPCREFIVLGGNPPLVQGACLIASVLVSMPLSLDSGCCG
jgi:hypothetical protein